MKSKKEHPLISVIFITYNRYEFLEKSVMNFTANVEYPNLELIVCDDGSEKKVQEKIRQLPFDKYLLSSKNKGLPHNTNKGIKAAEGDFILQIQDDMILKPGYENFLILSMKAFSENPKLGILRYSFNVPISPVFKTPYNDYTLFTFSHNYRHYKWKSGIIHSEHPHIKRRKFIEEIGLYNENFICFWGNMENDYALRCFAQKKWDIGYLNGYENIFNSISSRNDSWRLNSNKNESLKSRVKKIIPRWAIDMRRNYLTKKRLKKYM